MEQKVLPSTTLSILVIAEFITGVTGGVWLLILKQWWLVIGSAVFALFIPHVFALVMLPATMAEPRLLKAITEQRKASAAIIGFTIALYLNLIEAIWVLAVFAAFMIKRAAVPSAPLILCAYAIAMSPLTYLLAEEPKINVGTRRASFLTEGEFLVLVILFFAGVSPFVQLVAVLAMVILFSMLNTTLGVLEIHRATNSSSNLPS